ncbi:hypothetical protein CTAYLR_002450 [Chrysophaeum taylorii]|uniref:Alpha-type protein kinase domain-containing protein n=1 Tax=Chrysophaeum taylorii TaxID=2483200 RepID=A0AAD7UN97_9STRA|nr:hypothetical protein CTAYLR_002450 [Chrysophaeum taylorii]
MFWKKRSDRAGCEMAPSRTQELFRRAIAQARDEGDPWALHRLHDLPAERVRRHRYDVMGGTWKVDETLVKVERMAFDKGAMRRCYRLKKLSQQPNRPPIHPLNWRKSNNYIAKQYLDPTVMKDDGGRAAVLLDVQLQLTAAAFATAFDEALVPPKPVIIIDCFAIELYERQPVEYMLVERYITGKDEYGRGFIKHNSNIGYIDDAEKRLTPQVFSAATFWLSKGAALVTDIQGVGDLYTDPQVHCRSQRFGTGDLGRRGMAFFFQSYDGSRNPLYKALGVPQFRLSPAEKRRAANAESRITQAKRKAREGESLGRTGSDWGFFANMSARDDMLSLRFASATATRRAQRAIARKVDLERRDKREDADTIEAIEVMLAACNAQAARSLVGVLDDDVERLAPKFEDEFDVAAVLGDYCRRDRRRCQSLRHSDSTLSVRSSTSEMSGGGFFGWARLSSDDPKTNPHYANDIAERVKLLAETEDDEVKWALAEVHAALAELESEGRFTDWQPDAGSALFHAARAAELGSPVAAHALARWHAGLAPGALVPCNALAGQVPQEPGKAGPLLVLAARRGDPTAAFHAARAFTDGDLGLPADRRAADKLLRASLRVATAAHPGPISGFRLNDLVEVDYRNNGFFYEARIKEVRDDGTADVVYLEDDECERHVDWSRIRSRVTEKKFIPAGKAGAVLPPKHKILAELADLHSQNHRYKAAIFLDEAAEAAADVLAPRIAKNYRDRAARLRRRYSGVAD